MNLVNTLMIQFLVNVACVLCAPSIRLEEELGFDLAARKEELLSIVPHTEQFRTKTIQRESSSELKNDASGIVNINLRAGVAPYMFEGDINLTPNQIVALKAGKLRTKRQAGSENKWTNGNVYYSFDNAFVEEDRQTVRNSVNYLHQHTCISFYESENATNRIQVFNGSGCYSKFGMVGGVQKISLGNDCVYTGIAAHEFIHALGFRHTQARSDRDEFVTVDLTYVDPDKQHNYNKEDGLVYYTPYEYGSGMHYRANAFVNTKGKLAMVSLDPDYQDTMGTNTISFYDIRMLNAHYGCYDICTSSSTTADCQNNGYPNPRNCSECNCPFGYGGPQCDQRPDGCGATLSASESWQSETSQVGIEGGFRSEPMRCFYWITAPEGRLIEARVVSLENPWCQYGCLLNPVEIKYKSDKRVSNPRICCNEDLNRTVVSALNPTPVIVTSHYNLFTTVFEYRYI